MRRLRSAIALVLLAVWLPATLHCELEQFGVFAECDGCHAEGAAARDSDADGCSVVEEGGYRIDVLTLKAPETPQAWVLFLLAPAGAEASPSGRLETTSVSPDVPRTWQFVARAAPPPRAPSRLG